MLATSASVSTLGLLAGLPGTSLSWLQTVETLTTPSLLLLKVGRSFPNNPFPIPQVPHYLIGPRVYFVAIETEWTHVAANLDVGGDDIINIIAVKREDAVSETGDLLIDNVQVRKKLCQQRLTVYVYSSKLKYYFCVEQFFSEECKFNRHLADSMLYDRELGTFVKIEVDPLENLLGRSSKRNGSLKFSSFLI